VTPRRIAITLLGRLAIDREGETTATAFSGRRSELVFAYLAAEHRRDVSRDELVNALWPQELPDAWAAALRSVVSDVRRVIEASGLDGGRCLERTGGGYRLRLPSEAVVDLDEARTQLATARAELAHDPVRAARSATGAAGLARLPFLPRHGGDWVDGVRRELHSIHVEALELAARAYARAGDTHAAAAAAARLVEVEPYSDAAHRLRIEVLAAGGDRAGALGAYRHCHTTLVEQLGVEPSAETQAALQRALATAPVLATSEASRLGSLSALVVDDHDFQRQTAVTLLRRLGVGVVSEARDGTDALEQLRGSPPDVIVCDVDMPGMDGVEFIRNVAQRGLAGAVVVASGLERSVLHAVEAVGQGYGLQVLGVVEKPLTARRLSDLLGSYRRPPARGDADVPSETELRAALGSDCIEMRFAPIVDLQTGTVRGAASVAWSRDTDAAVAADEISDELAAVLADHLLKAACECARDPHDLTVWTPLAGSSLTDVNVADRLLGVVRARRAEPHRIMLTFGERQIRHSSPAELDVLTRLRVKGFGVCLEYRREWHLRDQALARIPLTALSVAPALIRGAASDSTQAAALEEVLDAAAAHSLPVVAEGCDSGDDYQLLLELGFNQARGEFISGPLRPDELVACASGWWPPEAAR
jgi:DNA-binding SARP family transcriptional activator/EAL domain-containing protein (putative c-di-GMP-specific phosphodiesterase class I)